MNWGTRLIIVFTCFAAMMITLVYKSYHTHFDLVSKDYYSDELKYQEKIDGRQNAGKLAPVVIEQDTAAVLISLPMENPSAIVTGEAWFYSSNDATRDRRLKLASTEGRRQIIPKKILSPGAYELKLSWKENETMYYHETKLLVR